jgi:hypothetical protein
MSTPGRRVDYMPLDDLQPALRNAKQHDAEGIGRSISRFGVVDLPIMDERTGRLVAGHGRREDLLARRERGEQPPDGVTKSKDGTWMVPVLRGWSSRSDEEAHVAGAALNHLTETGGWDNPLLGEILGDIAKADYELVLAAGWRPPDLDGIIAANEPVDVLTDVDTDAAHSENTDDAEARAGQLAGQTPQYASGLTEMILIYTVEDRAEASRLIGNARKMLGEAVTTSDIVLRALRLADATDWADE